ncbi:MAG: hypothetical protein CMJ36_05755 [Phycisphaerae bacterium]|nr:hypothetical protein [Phycisphaerae bacterium]
MNEQATPQQGDSPMKTPSRSGSRTNWWIMVGIVAVVMVFTVLPMIKAWQSVNAFEREARDAGYIMREGVSLVIEEPITTPTYLRGYETIEVHRGAETDIALATATATLDGRFAGSVSFLGKELTLLPGARIEGDLRIAAAKSVILRGEVLGHITGNVSRVFQPQTVDPPANEQPDDL